jgi:hypothetical protein
MLAAKNLRKSYWLIIGSGEPNELLQPVPDRMTTFLEPFLCGALESSERPPLHLLRILPAEELHTTLMGQSSVSLRKWVTHNP